MNDYIVRGIAAGGQIRVFAATTRNVVETARQHHEMSPIATVALGRLLTGGAMMGTMMKNDSDVVTIQIKGNGPIGAMTVTADSKGRVKGFVANPQVMLPLKDGKLDIAGALGLGVLSVIKDIGLREPYVGDTILVTSEIADDLTYYFATSEQVPSSVGLGVLMNKDNTVEQAGGFIIQLLPFASDACIDVIEKNIAKMSSVTNLLELGYTAESIAMLALEGLEPNVLDNFEVSYKCGCSRERTERILYSLNKKDIAELSQDESWKPTAVYATASVLYNNESDTFSNEHIRKAFDLAIDRAAATAAGGAENSPATGLVPYGIPDSGETEDDFRTTGGELCAIDEEGMSARATQAREELTYAGYYSTSMFPPVELLYVTGTENDAVASALQNMWSTTLGVNVMLRGVTQSEYNARMEAGNYELALQKVTALYDDAMGFLDRWCSEDEQNLISYENGTYDVLMGVARASEDPVARTAFLHDAETMLLGETALSPVYFDGTAHMLRDTLRGVYTDGFGNSYFAGVRANTD